MRQTDLQCDRRQRLNAQSNQEHLPHRTTDFSTNIVQLQSQFFPTRIAKAWQQSNGSLCRRITVEISHVQTDLTSNKLDGDNRSRRFDRKLLHASVIRLFASNDV